jgi:ribosomal protein S18 acetylase RimI-like enzyme
MRRVQNDPSKRTQATRDHNFIEVSRATAYNNRVAIDYRLEPDLTAGELADVFCRAGIRRPIEDLPRLTQMIARADLIITARDGSRPDRPVVGVARSPTDFCFACYLSGLAVDAAYQRQGIGKHLVQKTRDAIGDGTVLLLIAAPEANDYYPKIGFEKMDRAWWINRKR